MDRLDADDEPLRCRRTGLVAVRDIVQFVPFSKFKRLGPERLAMEVLEEVSAQLTGFFKGAGIVPNQPPSPEAFAPPGLAAGGAGGAVQASAPPPPAYSSSSGGGAAEAPPPSYDSGAAAA